MQRKKKFPIKVERNGVTVPIHRVHSSTGYTSCVMIYQENGSRKREGFTTISKARRAAKLTTSGNTPAAKLKPEECHAFLRAAEKLKPLGVPMDLAGMEYAEAMNRISGRATGLAAVQD